MSRRALLPLLILLLAVATAWFVTMREPQDKHLFVVKIPLTPDVEIRPVLAQGKLPRSETFEQIVKRTNPYAAVPGTYYGHEMQPLGDIVCDGKLINRGHYPDALAVTNSGKVVFLRVDKRRHDWRGYRTVLACSPMLVHKGRIDAGMLAPNKDLNVEAKRTVVGVTKDNELLLVVETDWVTLPEMAQTMLDLGAVDAMNLDGGGSCGLYHDGRILVSPKLRMVNLLTVVKRDRKTQSSEP